MMATVLELAGPEAPAEAAGVAAPRETLLPRAAVRLRRLTGVVLLLVAWQVAASTGLVAPTTLAGPVEVLRAAWHLLQDGTLLPALWDSLQRVVIGLAIGVPAGVLLAAVAGTTRTGENLVDLPMQMLRFLPVLALVPLDVLWLGIGDVAKVSLIVLAVAIPVYINTVAAIAGIDARYRELAATLELDRAQQLRRIVLPAAMPGFLVGLRLATGVAWLVLVVSEQINASNGIGYLMVKAQEFFQSDVILVGLAVYALLGLVSDVALRALERKVLAWRPTLR